MYPSSTRVFLGNVDCEMKDPISGELYGIASDSRMLSCKPLTKFIGPQVRAGNTYAMKTNSLQ